MKGRILIVDDDRAMCEMLEGALTRRGFETASRTSAEDALLLLGVQEFDVIVTDLNMQGTSGLELCQQVVANRPDVPVVVVTAFGSLETAVGAIRAGAYDFVTKPFEMEDIALTLERAVQHRQLREEVKRLRTAVRDSQQVLDMIGTSSPMQKVYDLVGRVAETEATILVTGESGTGKELVAKAVHERSRRKEGPFVAINCAAMPEALLESELFGHTKGAFTDARQARQGLFLKASGGTLLLDEIGEMPPGMQAKLLRVLQERTVRPVGGDKEIPFDTRIIAATNRDLDTEVAERRFREDLFYRINVVRISVPPLRARGSDVLVLAQHFVERFAAVHRASVKGISSAAAERLMSYSWPGNVRELQNCMERAVALARYETLGVDDLPEKLRDYRPQRVIVESEDPSELLPMEEVERRYVLRVLQAVGGNKTLAAEVLGFDRRTLYRKLERYEAGDKSPSGSLMGSHDTGPQSALPPSSTPQSSYTPHSAHAQTSYAASPPQGAQHPNMAPPQGVPSYGAPPQPSHAAPLQNSPPYGAPSQPLHGAPPQGAPSYGTPLQPSQPSHGAPPHGPPPQGATSYSAPSQPSHGEPTQSAPSQPSHGEPTQSAPQGAPQGPQPPGHPSGTVVSSASFPSPTSLP